MKTIKVSEATSIQLDYLVAKCEGVEVEHVNDGITNCLLRISPFTGHFNPTAKWDQGGPIIERENLKLVPIVGFTYWYAEKLNDERLPYAEGPTPLIAAMRCYVVSKLGETAEVPGGIVMPDIFDATNERDYYRALQRRINDGSIWNFEGSAGRAAADAIANGFCCLGRFRHRDYWGSLVPCRDDIQANTKGSLSFVRQQMGDSWARAIGRVK